MKRKRIEFEVSFLVLFIMNVIVASLYIYLSEKTEPGEYPLLPVIILSLSFFTISYLIDYLKKHIVFLNIKIPLTWFVVLALLSVIIVTILTT